MAVCDIGLDQGGVPIPDSPFPTDSWIYVKVPDTGNPTFQILLAPPPLTNAQDFKAAESRATDQDVWAFEASRLACCTVGLAALAQHMLDTVTPLNKTEWSNRITGIAPQIQQLVTLTKQLCDKVSTTVDK